MSSSAGGEEGRKGLQCFPEGISKKKSSPSQHRQQGKKRDSRREKDPFATGRPAVKRSSSSSRPRRSVLTVGQQSMAPAERKKSKKHSWDWERPLEKEIEFCTVICGAKNKKEFALESRLKEKEKGLHDIVGEG